MPITNDLQMTDHIVRAELALDNIWAVGQPLQENSKALLDVGRQRESALGSELKEGLGHVPAGS